MKNRMILQTIAGIFFVLIIIAVLYYFTSNRERQEIPTGEIFISNYTGYVAGYVNETVSLTVYWLKIGSSNFSGAIGIRNLPPCLESKGIDLDVYCTNSRVKIETITVTLRLKKIGRCIMDNAYLEVWQGNSLKKVPLGSIEFEIIKPAEERGLKILSHIGALIGPEPSVPRLMYTILNPFNETVEILNVTFNVPGLKVSSFEPKVIGPGESVNFTVRIVNTSKLNDLYVIKPLIVYQMGNKTNIMPLEVFYHATIPDEKRLVEMIKSQTD
ncbi:hypothetical protein [Pyrococcus abyssi]|uniref:Uncharacterized protein n=1 Tax=Pyrococcus abyssi (strain GE5 / Orsay) TaxID=272844 RepID=Q9UYK6_PYRAB|nr:hypothetical protein [Pyrococcus abyssi]CAB50406.1 Hypothetical protein PAB1373 [Pyrococcus abyssi GE5]CCE70954.1 TPA: hypothetical protein PAB1373 [Pyrococcus abyssi GE5]